MIKNVRFLKQIPYIQNWAYKEVVAYFEFFKNKEIRIAQRNRIICKEGEKSDKIYIVLQGEVEVVKTNLNAVFYNRQTGILGIKEINKKGAVITSN